MSSITPIALARALTRMAGRLASITGSSRLTQSANGRSVTFFVYSADGGTLLVTIAQHGDQRQTVRPVKTSFDKKRHEFLQADGSWKMCAGPRYCRECIRTQDARKAARNG